MGLECLWGLPAALAHPLPMQWLLVGSLAGASQPPWVLSHLGTHGQAGRDVEGGAVSAASWPAGSVMGCVYLGLAGQHLVDGREEKLKNIIEGE